MKPFVLLLQAAVQDPAVDAAPLPFLERVYAGTTARDWIIALCVFAGAVVLFGLLKRLTLLRLAKWAERTETDLDDLIVDLVRRTSRFYLIALAARLASHWLVLSETTHDWLTRATILATFIQVGLWGVGLVQYGLARLVKDRAQEDPIRTMGSSILGMIGRGLVWITVLLLCLSNLGVDVTALITGLGVGGIAVALALQNILGDLFASITILLDKPFVVGDAIQLGEFTGTVEQIGIKTTRLRSVNGELIVVGNSDLVNSRIRNYKRLTERRCVFTIGVTYSTRPEHLEALPAILAACVEATPETRLDRAHFKSFGDWALIFEVVFFSVRPEYNAMMDAQQAINLKIKRRLSELGVEMAFPTQTVIYANSVAAPTPPAR